MIKFNHPKIIKALSRFIDSKVAKQFMDQKVLNTTYDGLVDMGYIHFEKSLDHDTVAQINSNIQEIQAINDFTNLKFNVDITEKSYGLELFYPKSNGYV